MWVLLIGRISKSLLFIIFSIEMREVRDHKFFNVQKGNMSVIQYTLMFIQISMYARTILANTRVMKIKFVLGLSRW